MTKRNKTLNAALKLLNPLTGGQAPDLNDGTPLGFYQAVRAGKKVVSYGDRDAASQPGALVPYVVRPFADPDADANDVLVTVSRRAESALGTVSLTAAELNISKLPADIANADEVEGFIPARATVTVKGTAETSKTSKTTGRRYKTKGGNSYTFPFGLKSTALTAGYKAVKAAILTSAKAENRSVSFTPEVYR